MELCRFLFPGGGKNRTTARICSTIAGALLAFLPNGSGPAVAQTSKPQATGSIGSRAALVDGPLRNLITDSPGALSWTATEEARTVGRLCEPGDDMRVALTVTKIDQQGKAVCKQAGRTVLFQKMIGSVVVVPVAQAGSAFNLTSGQLFSALTAQTGNGQTQRPAKWSDIDSTLPDSAIRILLPAVGSLEDRVLVATALQHGCVAVQGQNLPMDSAARAQACSALRSDAAVARAAQGKAASDWLKTAPPGAVAFVGYGQLMADGELVGLMTIDGRLATSATLVGSEYLAAMPIYVAATRPSGLSESRRQAAVALADALLSESAIGPYGNVARHGLAPLPAQERIAVRNAFGQFLTRTGVWE